METKDWTLTKVYHQALSHELAGVMFHKDACRYMAFLGLSKMMALQEHQYKEESNSLQDTEQTFLQRHDMLIEAEYKVDDQEELIPREARVTKSSTVGIEFKRKTLASFLDKWYEWETRTEKLYAIITAWCIENQCADYAYFQKLLEKVCVEKTMVYCMKREMSLAGWALAECELIADEWLKQQ